MLPARPPTEQELQRLLKLYGQEDAVIAHYARQYNLDRGYIAATVRAWLKTLPGIAPPSRQRSAPADLLPEREAAATGASQAIVKRPEVLLVKTPPASAPVFSSSSEAVKAMMALDNRLNQNLVVKGGGRAGTYNCSQRLSLGQRLSSTPEEPVSYMPMEYKGPACSATDDAASRYLQRECALGNRIGPSGLDALGMKLEPNAARVSSTWMTRGGVGAVWHH